MDKETSEDLLVIISMKAYEPEAAIRAFNEFFKRFKNDIWKASFSLTREMANQQYIVECLVHDTFTDVYMNSDRESYFDPLKCQDINKGIKNWLYGIMKYHFKRHLEAAAQIAKNVQYLEVCPDVPFFESYDKSFDIADTPSKELVRKAYETELNDRDREILLISLNFEKEGRLPDDIKESLCKAYGILPVSLRQIKKRALSKIDAYLQKYSFLMNKIKSNVK